MSEARGQVLAVHFCYGWLLSLAVNGNMLPFAILKIFISFSVGSCWTPRKGMLIYKDKEDKYFIIDYISPIPGLERNQKSCSSGRHTWWFGMTQCLGRIFLSWQAGLAGENTHPEKERKWIPGWHQRELPQKNHTYLQALNNIVRALRLSFAFLSFLSFKKLESHRSSLMIIGIIFHWQCFSS